MGLSQSTVKVNPSEEQTGTNKRCYGLANLLISRKTTDDCCRLQFLNMLAELKPIDLFYRYPKFTNNDGVSDHTLLHLAVSHNKRCTAVEIANRVPDLVFDCVDNLKRKNAAFELTPLGIAVATNPMLAIDFLNIVKNKLSNDAELRRVIVGEPMIPDEAKKHDPEVECTVSDKSMYTASGTQSQRNGSTSTSNGTILSEGDIEPKLLSSRDKTGKEHAHVTGDEVNSKTHMDNGGGPDEGALKSEILAPKDASTVTNGSPIVVKDGKDSTRFEKDSARENNGSPDGKAKTVLGGTILMGQLPFHIAVLSLISKQIVQSDVFKQKMKDTQEANNDRKREQIGQQNAYSTRHRKLTTTTTNQRFPFRKGPYGTKANRAKIHKQVKNHEHPIEATDLECFEKLELVMDKLEKYGASVGNRNYMGDTVFHSILRFVNCFPEKEKVAVKIIEYLIKCRFKKDEIMKQTLWAKNNDDVTALQLTVEFGLTKVFRALMRVEGLYYHRISPYEEMHKIRTIDVTEFDKLTMLQAWKRSIQSLPREEPVPKTGTPDGMKVRALGNPVLREAHRNKPKEEMEKHRKLVKKNVTSGNSKSLPQPNDGSDDNAGGKENTTLKATPERSDNFFTEKWRSIEELRTFNKHQSVIELLCSSSLSTCLDMVVDDVFEAIIDRKWPSYRWFFYGAFIIHIVVLIWLSVYAIAKAHVMAGDGTFPEAFVTATQVLSIMIALVYFLQEVVVRCWFARQPFYFHALHHNVVYRVFTILFSLSLFGDSVSSFVVMNNYGLIIALVIGGWNLLFFLRGLSFFSIYVVFINDALITVVLPVAVLVFMQVFIFAVGMHATFLVPENENATVADFESYGKSILNMGKLIIGLSEFSYLLNAREDFISLLLFGGFIVITFLLLINGLIAAMTNGFTDLQKKKVEIDYIQKLSIIVFLEAYFFIATPAVSNKDMKTYMRTLYLKTPGCQFYDRYILSDSKVPSGVSDNPNNMIHKVRNRFSNMNDLLVDIDNTLMAYSSISEDVKMLKSSMMELNKMIEEGRLTRQQAKTIHLYHFSK